MPSKSTRLRHKNLPLQEDAKNQTNIAHSLDSLFVSVKKIIPAIMDKDINVSVERKYSSKTANKPKRLLKINSINSIDCIAA